MSLGRTEDSWSDLRGIYSSSKTAIHLLAPEVYVHVKHSKIPHDIFEYELQRAPGCLCVESTDGIVFCFIFFELALTAYLLVIVQEQ